MAVPLARYPRDDFTQPDAPGNDHLMMGIDLASIATAAAELVAH